jgi:hypothetical protein
MGIPKNQILCYFFGRVQHFPPDGKKKSFFLFFMGIPKNQIFVVFFRKSLEGLAAPKW